MDFLRQCVTDAEGVPLKELKQRLWIQGFAGEEVGYFISRAMLSGYIMYDPDEEGFFADQIYEHGDPVPDLEKHPYLRFFYKGRHYFINDESNLQDVMIDDIIIGKTLFQDLYISGDIDVMCTFCMDKRLENLRDFSTPVCTQCLNTLKYMPVLKHSQRADFIYTLRPKNLEYVSFNKHVRIDDIALLALIEELIQRRLII